MAKGEGAFDPTLDVEVLPERVVSEGDFSNILLSVRSYNCGQAKVQISRWSLDKGDYVKLGRLTIPEARDLVSGLSALLHEFDLPPKPKEPEARLEHSTPGTSPERLVLPFGESEEKPVITDDDIPF